MNRFVFFLVLVGILCAGMFFVLYKTERTSDLKQGGKLSVVTTLFPLYDFAREVGGERVEVTLLLPPGVEAHSFEPTPRDMTKIGSADVFVYMGKIMEPWAEDIARGALGDHVRVVDASAGILMVPGTFHDADEPEGSPDPHIWLDFENAKKMVDDIRRVFSERDPDHVREYAEAAGRYMEALRALDEEYRASLSICATKTIVYGGHYAFGYVAHRYGLEYMAAQGLSPDAEPTAKGLAALANQIRMSSVKYVFYEELSNPKIAETIAHETGAKLLSLNAAHNISKKDYNSGVTFLSIMEENRKNLVKGLGCHTNLP